MVIQAFPPIQTANEDGLLALGGDLEIPSLLLAYSKGIFPWPISMEYPLAWFSPNPRGIIKYVDLKIPKSMQKIINKNNFEIRFNQNFQDVIRQCALAKNRKGQTGTWITEDIIHSYMDFHHAGYAYSAETYLEGKLVGGIYGVCIGNFVSGESMFYTKSNASKFALIMLLEYLNTKGVTWLDTQMVTPVVETLGGQEIPREQFIKMLKSLKPRPISSPIF